MWVGKVTIIIHEVIVCGDVILHVARPLSASLGLWYAEEICYNGRMSTISLHDLAHDPVALLDRVTAGEHFVVIRDGHPVAELRPITMSGLNPRPYGLAVGAFVVPDDFDDPLPNDILREFEGQ